MQDCGFWPFDLEYKWDAVGLRLEYKLDAVGLRLEYKWDAVGLRLYPKYTSTIPAARDWYGIHLVPWAAPSWFSG